MYRKGLANMLAHKAVERLQAWVIISLGFLLDMYFLNAAKVARNKQTSKENININGRLTFVVEADSDMFCTFATVGVLFGGSRWQGWFVDGRWAIVPPRSLKPIGRD